MLTKLKKALPLDTDKAEDIKGHAMVGVSALLILDKLADAAVVGNLSWAQILVMVLILVTLAIVSYCNVGSGGNKYKDAERPEADYRDDLDPDDILRKSR